VQPILPDPAKLVAPEPTGSNKFGEQFESFFDREKWKERFDGFKALSIAEKVVIILGALLALGLVILVIRIIFSSVIALIVTVTGGYIIYHAWGAKYITRYKYDKTSKVLQLPKGMSDKTLLEALIGKFNYPYFKGVRYGECGECIIEGQYSVYPVIFGKNKEATLTCDLNIDEKKIRTAMLEAIAIRQYINKFFNPSLPFDAVVSYKSLQSAEKQRKTVAIVLSIASFLLIAAITLEYAAPGSLKHIMTPGAEVRGAYLAQYSKTITIEDAFKNFFGNRKWSTYKEAGDSYVVFSGTCEFMGEKVHVKITFKILSEQFVVDSLEVDGQKQNDLILFSLLSAVYEDY